MHGFRARLDYWLKHNKAFYKCFNFIASNVLKLWGKFIPMDDNLVVFSAHSRRYNDSPKALYEYMIAHSDDFKGLKYVWALEDPDHVSIPGPATKVKSDTLAYFKATLKAKYWITCVNIERSLHYKKKKCRYLNTWHGAPIKYGGNDAVGRQDYDFSSVDVYSYASEFELNISKHSLGFRDDACIPYGSPRNDVLYHTTEDEIVEIKKRLRIPLDKTIILYAPTWRDSSDGGKTYAMRPPINMSKFKEALKDDYILLMRTHQYTNKLLGVDFDDFCRDFCSYPDVNDLLKVSDILISDYSAIIADFSIFERPVLCFAYDYEDFKMSRGLYLDYYKDMPSGILRTDDEVIDYIQRMDYGEESLKTKHLLKEKLAKYGGNATKHCLDRLFEREP